MSALDVSHPPRVSLRLGYRSRPESVFVTTCLTNRLIPAHSSKIKIKTVLKPVFNVAFVYSDLDLVK